MERVTARLPESPARRAVRIARVGARYGFGFAFGNRFVPRRRRADPGRVGTRLRLSFEELGPTFAELGRFLSARRDLLPPDVAAELGRTAAVAKPLPPAETRALVERELGNTLERLFLQFEQAPTRVNAFTQAHRAVLPGDRPALVVVARTGVRRDLLAMRPVADLARRRLSGRLPLDPTATVAEFATHAAHRRDMFFAAQAARRLREMEGLRLRVPDVYRGYSSGRCVTFEAPVDAAPLEPERYGEVSEALVRLAMAEGVFLTDLAPERFATDDPLGEVWLADPTEAFTFDPERLRGVAEVAQMARSLVEAEELAGRPEIVAAAEAAETLISHHRAPAYVAARAARRLAQPDPFANSPRQPHALLNELRDGEIEVRFRHGGLDELIPKVDILDNRLVFGLLIAALILGSSMLGIFVEGGAQLLGLSVFGLIGFVFAAVLGLLLLFAIIRSGRL